MDFVA